MKLTSSNKPGLGKVGSSPLTRSPIRWRLSPIRLEHPSYGTTLYRSLGVAVPLREPGLYTYGGRCVLPGLGEVCQRMET